MTCALLTVEETARRLPLVILVLLLSSIAPAAQIPFGYLSYDVTDP
jgi:hypothetical protein